MNNKDVQLEQVIKSMEEFEMTKAPPIFELYAALVAISLSILLFLSPSVFVQDSMFYNLMQTVLPQSGWGIVFFFVGIMAALGMLFDLQVVRIISLVLMTAAFGIVTAFYIAIFPNLAGILMFWLTIFTASSIPMVKYTGLRKYKDQSNKDGE